MAATHYEEEGLFRLHGPDPMRSSIYVGDAATDGPGNPRATTLIQPNKEATRSCACARQATSGNI